jgi:hypothetical protein
MLEWVLLHLYCISGLDCRVSFVAYFGEHMTLDFAEYIFRGHDPLSKAPPWNTFRSGGLSPFMIFPSKASLKMSSKLSLPMPHLLFPPKHSAVISSEPADFARQNSLTTNLYRPREASGLANPVNQQSLDPSDIICVSKWMTLNLISAHKAL